MVASSPALALRPRQRREGDVQDRVVNDDDEEAETEDREDPPPPFVHLVAHGPPFRDEGGVLIVATRPDTKRIRLVSNVTNVSARCALHWRRRKLRLCSDGRREPPSLRTQRLQADDRHGDTERDRDDRQRTVHDVEPGGAVLARHVEEAGDPDEQRLPARGEQEDRERLVTRRR